MITFNVDKIRSGKTERLINIAKESSLNKKKVLFVLPTREAVDSVWKKTRISNITLTTPELCLRESGYNILLLDEYLYYPDKIQSDLNRYIGYNGDFEIFIETTSKYLLNKKLFHLCVYLRKSKLPSYTIDFMDSQINGEFSYLYDNLLTHPSTSLCIMYDYWKHLHYGSNIERFEVEYMGKIFKE